jgi:phosphoribosylamine--glycine ligase
MDTKKFLFVTLDALTADTAWQVVKEGHEVKFATENPDDKEVGDGFVPKVEDWKAEVDWADVIIFDDVLGQGKKAEALRKAGKKVVGGTVYTDRLEDDRAFGQEELKNVGVPIISHENFTSFDDAIAYVKANPGRYVIKSSGEAQNMKSLLFVGEEETGKDVLYILDAYKTAWSKQIRAFQLQKRILGVEVAVGAFFNGKEFVYPINVNFEHKKLFPGDIGPQTGEMGTLMFWSEPNRMFNATLKKMEPKLASEGYVGYMDINCIVNSNGIYPLEFTARFGYPTISIQAEGILMPISEFLYGLVDGSLQKFKTRAGFQMGIRIVVPPFPFNDKKTFEVNSKDAVVMFKKPAAEGIHIEDVKLLNGEWVVTGTSGVILIVTGTGPTVKQCQKSVYNKVDNIMIPNMYYRTDIGDKWGEDSDKLHSWGYLREV